MQMEREMKVGWLVDMLWYILEKKPPRKYWKSKNSLISLISLEMRAKGWMEQDLNEETNCTYVVRCAGYCR